MKMKRMEIMEEDEMMRRWRWMKMMEMNGGGWR